MKLKLFRKVHSKAVLGLGWSSLVFAAIGGAFAAGTDLGQAVRWLGDHSGPDWVPVLALVILFVGGLLDVITDLLPTRLAVGAVMLLPSLATAAPGGLGRTLTGWAKAFVRWSDASLHHLLGTDSSLGIALCAIAVSVILARGVLTGTKRARKAAY